MSESEDLQLISAEFEVFGQVQGCYFTKYCKELAEQLGIVGWVKNSKTGTIVGKIQGIKAPFDHIKFDVVALMKTNKWPIANKSERGAWYAFRIMRIDWLKTTGSPGCKIEKCELKNLEHITRIGYTDFSIRF